MIPSVPEPNIENAYVRELGYARRYRDERFCTGSGPRTHARERDALARLLRHPCVAPGLWLDLPSGAGRMSELLPGAVVQVDRDPEMVALCAGGAGRVCASGFALPFRDAAFTGALCHRLVQHLEQSSQRLALFRELRRITKGPVILSYFDANSLQHLRRRISGWLGKRSRRHAVTHDRIATELSSAGLTVVARTALLRFVSEQTLALAFPT